MSECIMHDNMDNLARAIDNLYSAISALAVDCSATGHMSEAVGKVITIYLYRAGVDLCEYWKAEKGAE